MSARRNKSAADSLPATTGEKPKRSARALASIIERSARLQGPAAAAYVERLRRADTDAGPATIVAKLEKRYVAAVTASGAAVGTTAVLPGVGTLAALTAAAVCSPGATGQCQHLVDTSLSCPGCKRYVNDVTELDALSNMWTDQNCAATFHTACPAIACVVPGPATCAATSGTPGGPSAGASPGGSCTSVGVTNNSP